MSSHETLEKAQDSFDGLIADGTSNRGDIPSEYDFNARRHRAYVTPDGGSRTRVVTNTDLNGASGLVKLANTTSFNDPNKGFELNPAAGEVVEYGSAERFRYVPGYEFGFGGLTLLDNGGNGLEPGQELLVRFGIQTDAYDFRYRASEDGEHEVRLVKNNSPVTDSVQTESDWGPNPFGDGGGASLTRPIMHRGKFVHYGGGEFRPSISYLKEDLNQVNTELTRTGNRDAIATEEVNGFIRVIYDCSNSASGGTCLVGDLQAKVHGQVAEKDRTPPHRHRGLGTSTNFSVDSWEGAVLLRNEPGRENVSIDLRELGFIPSAAAEVALFAVPKETIPWPGDSDWFSPPVGEPEDSAIEAAIVPSAERTNYPSRTVDGETLPEARAIIHTEAQDTQSGSRSAREASDRTKAKLHEDEYGLIAVRFSGGSGSITTLRYVTLEDH